MRQRAALLRTVVQERPVLLLDEPFGALDSLTRAEMQAWLAGVRARYDWTVLLVTHDIREAVFLSDRVVVLDPPARRPCAARCTSTCRGPATSRPSPTRPSRAPRPNCSAPSCADGRREMARYCFQLQVRPERLDEYKARHRAVWPEMLAALRDTGWRNYSLFLRDDGLLIGYVEADDLQAAQAGMAATR